jgi:hypothetical protein
MEQTKNIVLRIQPSVMEQGRRDKSDDTGAPVLVH